MDATTVILLAKQARQLAEAKAALLTQKEALKGADGANGANGTNGADGAASTVAGPTGSAGADGAAGANGAAGASGADGADGADGVSVHVTDADIDFDNRFTFNMSDGSELVTAGGINLEEAVKAYGRGPSGPQGPTGAAGRDGTGYLQQVKLPYVNVESNYLTSGIAMGSGDEQNLLDSSVWSFTVEGDLLNQGTGTLDITSDNAFEPDFTGRVRMTCTVVFSSSSVPQGYLVIRNNGTDVSGYETFYKTHLDMTGTKLSSEIDIVIDVVSGDSIVPFFGVGSGSCDVHQSYTDILRLDFEASMTDGADGTNGTNGTNGADGIAGSRWYSGNGNPSSSLGATGDYYLDGTSGNIWTRTPSQWVPSGENIMGPAGAAAVDLIPLDNTWSGDNSFNTHGTAFGVNLWKTGVNAPTASGSVYMSGLNLRLSAPSGQVVFDDTATFTTFNVFGASAYFALATFGAGITLQGGVGTFNGACTFNGGMAGDGSGLTGIITTATLKSVVAASTDFADFKTRVAAL